MPFNKQMHNFWSYKKEDDQYSSVQLILWAKGLCAIGTNDAGDLVAGMAYSYDQVYELRILENIILNEPLLADPTLVKKVMMSVSRHLIIPQDMMDNRDILDEWLSQVHYIEYDEDINTAHVNDLGVDVIFPKKKVVRSILSQYFPERQSKFFIAPASLIYNHDHDHVFIMMLEDNCALTFYKGQKLIHHTIIDWSSVEDIIAQVHMITENCAMEFSQLQWRLGGISSTMTQLNDELSSYFSAEQYQYLSPEVTFKALSLCE